ncbi:hypothetical protein [Agromyces mariniharenae]|uniref:Uncharacterized protein n=1 Tax=Agromyces mariniharenae TaxID=2604423 RepID=A0A5S4V9W0_9MICO|nr:hypothetical protein [Agromyces mariniharenae]TYL54121.1 hypothetical protein FYC51_11080 [Agromyces mariniharenae]
MAVFATFVASLAHTIGGGAPPGPVALAVALAFSAPLAMALSGARARMLRTAVSALVAQGVLHLTYAIGAPSTPSMRSGHASAHLSVPAASVDHGDSWMPVAHLAAAALTLAALVAGDRVFDAVRRALRVAVRRVTTIPVPVVAPAFSLLADAPRPRFAALLLVSGLGSRGPPNAVAAS